MSKGPLVGECGSSLAQRRPLCGVRRAHVWGSFEMRLHTGGVSDQR